MTYMAEIKQVISKLAERTEESRVPWRRDDLTSDTYKASFGKMTITVMGGGAREPEKVYLHIAGNRGETIAGAFFTPEEPEENSELVSILNEARKLASDDPRLDQLLEALEVAPQLPNCKTI